MTYWTDTIFRPTGRWPARKDFSRLILVLLRWQERAQQRYLLQQLDDALLRDIGLSRADVMRECSKPFWRA